MAIDLEAELERIVDALSEAKVPYALCGGLALAVHGLPRATKDIDLLVPAERVEAVADALARAGFTLRAGPIPLGVGTANPQTLHRASRIIDGDPCTVDLLLVSPGYSEAWTTRTEVPWKGRRLPVVSREGLISMKRLSTRLKDRADVASLVGEEDA